jgi:hypothetical protein
LANKQPLILLSSLILLYIKMSQKQINKNIVKWKRLF